MKKIILSAVLVISVLLSAQTAFAQDSFAGSSKMDSLLNTLDVNHKAMASVTFMQDDTVVYSRAIGFIDNSGSAPVNSTTETRYRIGSITKMFTAVMILQLIEENKLSLDTHLSKFFKKIPNADSITIEDMLNHHSGLLNFTDSKDYPKWMTQARSRKQLLDLFATQKPSFAPHTQAEYSNTNYVLLGYIIEDVTGKSYQQNLSERITSRIGLKNTKYGGKINHTANEASSFIYKDGKWVTQPETNMSIPGGAGAIISTTPDLTAFINALFNGKLISESSLQTMTSLKDKFGLGIFRIPFFERSAYAHNGGIDGFSSSLSYFPDEKLSVAYCSNGLNYPMNDILIGMLSCYFNRAYTIPNFKSISIPAEKLSGYTGEYRTEQISLVILINHDGGSLTAQASGQPAFKLDAVSETEFRFDRAGIVMIFNISDNGSADGFTLKQGGTYIYKKVVKE